jgi:hypothetical protein
MNEYVLLAPIGGAGGLLGFYLDGACLTGLQRRLSGWR